jgi:hypothetical protein
LVELGISECGATGLTAAPELPNIQALKPATKKKIMSAIVATRKRGRLILSAARVLNLHNKDVRRAHNPRLKQTGLRRSDAADQGLRAGAIDRVGLSQDRRKERDAISPRNMTVGEVVCSSRGATSGSR